MEPTIKEMLFLARRQWSTVLTLELASAGKYILAKLRGSEMNDPMSYRSAFVDINNNLTYSGVLVGITVVLLSPKGTGLNIGQTSDVSSPLGLESHLDELGILLLVNHCPFRNELRLTSIMVVTIPKNDSYEGKRPCRPVKV